MGRGTTIVGKVLLKQQAAKGTAVSSWSAADAVYCEMFIPDRGAEAIDPEVYTGGFHQGPLIQGSKAGRDILLKIPIPGLSDDNVPTADPTPHHLAYAMGDALGGLSVDGYQADMITGSTTTAVNVTAGIEAHSGHAVIIPQTSGINGIGWIKQHTSNVYTLANALSGTPQDSGTIYGTATAYLNTSQPAKLWTLAHTYGVVGGTSYYDGTVIKARITGGNGKKGYIELTIRFPIWDNIAAGALAPYAYSHPMMPIIEGPVGGRFPVTLDSGDVGVANSFIEITCEVEEEPDWSRPSGVDFYNVVDRKVLWTVETPLPETGDLYDVGFQYGSEVGPLQSDFCSIVGKAFGAFMGNPVVKAQTPIIALGKLIGQRLQFAPGLYTGDTETTAPAGTDFRTFFG